MPTELLSKVSEQIEMPDEPVFEMGTLGKGLTLKTRKTMNLDESKAEELLNLPEFAGDRPLNESHVIFLARQMQGHLFRWEQVSIITCRCNGKEYRMNGQHTCWARLEIAKETKLTNCPVQHLLYHADSDQDMRQLYATIDRNKARTNGNVVISYLAGRPEFVQFHKKGIKALAEGLAFWLWEKDSTRQLHVADERAFLMLTTHYKLTTYVGNFLNRLRAKEAKHMMRRPVVSAMFATFDKAPQIAEEFWSKVRDGDQLEKNDPRLRLRTDLMQSTIAAGGDSRSNDETTVSSEEMYRHCIQAWNAFRDGSELKVFRNPVDKPRSAIRG